MRGGTRPGSPVPASSSQQRPGEEGEPGERCGARRARAGLAGRRRRGTPSADGLGVRWGWRSRNRTRLLASAGLPVPATFGDGAGMLAGSVTEFEPSPPRLFPRKQHEELGAQKNQVRRRGHSGSWLIYFCPAGAKHTHTSLSGVLLIPEPSSEELFWYQNYKNCTAVPAQPPRALPCRPDKIMIALPCGEPCFLKVKLNQNAFPITPWSV